MHFDSILALTDFSAPSEQALDRAALLAAQHQAPLRLLHFSTEARPFFGDPLARLAQRARQMTRRHGVRAHAVQRQLLTADEVVQESRSAGLLVCGPLWQRQWKTFYRGTLLDQFVHHSHCPVLVVKKAATQRYGQVLVAVDLSPRSRGLIDFAQRVAQPEGLQLFHTIDTLETSRLRSADVSLEAAQAHRVDSHQRARTRLVDLTHALGAKRASACVDVGNGDPAYQTAVQQLATRAELVVVGQRRRSALAQFFTGSVAQRLAKWADGDVLVVPFDGLAEPAGELVRQT